MHRLLNRQWCIGSPTGADNIYLFESLEQADRFMSFYHPSQLIGDEHGIVSGEFLDVDATAAQINGLTLVRSTVLATPRRPLTTREARLLFDEAIAYSDLGAAWFSLHLRETIVDNGDTGEPGFADLRSSALVSRGMTFGQLGLSGDAIALWNAAVDEYGDSPSDIARQAAARAAMLVGFELSRAQEFDDAIAFFDAAIEIGSSTQGVHDSTVPEAMWGKAVALHLTNRASEAAELRDAIISDYGHSTDPTIESIVTDSKALLEEIR